MVNLSAGQMEPADATLSERKENRSNAETANNEVTLRQLEQ